MTLHASHDYNLTDRQPREGRITEIGTNAAEAPRQASRQDFLEGMRKVACSVAVVTTDGPGGRHGATVSAFASVSADPPTVLVCLRSASRISAAVGRNGVFTVSVLTEQDQDVARAFAGEFDAARADRFADVRLASLPGLAPGIADTTIFACTVIEMLQQHTHAVFIGHVARVVAARRPPLLYHDNSYTRLPGRTNA